MGLANLKRRVITENTIVSPHQSRLLVSLDGSYITYHDVNPLNCSNLRLTNCQYMIRYDAPRVLSQLNKGNPERPFTIGTDLIGFHLTVAGPQQFRKLAETMPEIKWMVENTNFSYKLFHMARTHLGTCIPFCVNMEKYENKILQQAKKEGLKDIKDFNAFVSFRCAVAREKDYTKTLPFPPRADHYHKELEEAFAIKEKFEVKNNKEHESEESTQWIINRACKNT